MPGDSATNDFSRSLGDTYKIRIQGILDPCWSDWLACSDFIHTEAGDTVLFCTFQDQPAMHGLLVKIRDLNLKILSLTLVDPQFGAENKR